MAVRKTVDYPEPICCQTLAARSGATGRLFGLGYCNVPWKTVNGNDLCSAFNFGTGTDGAATVKNTIELARSAYGPGDIDYENYNDGPHEAGSLALETAKARVLLGVMPRWTLPETVQRTMAWYLAQHRGCDARALCEAEIGDYEALL